MSPQRALEAGAGPLPERLVHALARVSLALRYGLRRQAAARGLTPIQSEILVWLRSHPEAALSDVARGLGVTPATVSDAVDALQAKKLLRKRWSRQDARALRLGLTARGSREAQRAAGWLDFLVPVVGSLDAEGQQILLSALIRLIKALQDLGRIPVVRMCVTCAYFRPYVHLDAARPHHCALVNAAFGDRLLRIDCPEYSPAPEAVSAANWQAWSSFHSEEVRP